MPDESMNALERVFKDQLQKVKDASLSAGLFTGCKSIKDIIDKNVSDKQKLIEIEQFVNKCLSTLGSKENKD